MIVTFIALVTSIKSEIITQSGKTIIESGNAYLKGDFSAKNYNDAYIKL